MPIRTHGLDELDIKLLRILRYSSRTSLRELSLRTEAPLSTIFHRVRALLGTTISRTTIVVSLPEVVPLRVFLWISALSSQEFLEVISLHPSFNTLCRVGPRTFYLAEGYFSSMKELEETITKLQEKGALTVHERHVLEELRYEDFFPW